MSAKHRPVHHPFNRAAVGAVALAALIAAAGAAKADDWTTPAAPAHAEEVPVADLERAFWYCDYVATTEGIQATPVAACRFATEQLKKQKFGGSFSQMLEWWRANKPAEHHKLASLAER